MLWSVKELHGYTILAADGEIGKVDEFYFDAQEWMICYLQVDISKWLTGKQSLVSPLILSQPNQADHTLSARLTRAQLKNCPNLDLDNPTSRQNNGRSHAYPQWPVQQKHLGIPATHTATKLHSGATAVAWQGEAYRETLSTLEKTEEWGDTPHLQSTREVIGYHIQARDGEIGHVEDFIVDDQYWMIRHLVVHTRNWLPGRKVLVTPKSIGRVRWAKSKVYVSPLQETIKDSPGYDPVTLLNQEPESGSNGHYGWLKL